MALKNYYAILGVSPNETPAGIRAAYRNAVQRTHPDHAGPQAAPAFQEVVEAHSVLSDPDRRQQYNEDLKLYQPDGSRVGRSYRSGLVDMHVVHPSFEAGAERLLRNFAGLEVPRAERSGGMSIEVILTPEEAASGGVLSFGIPVREECGACRGTGMDWLFRCLHCGGKGTVPRMQAVRVSIPQSIRLAITPEVIFKTPVETSGINKLFLTLRIRVSNEQFY